MTRNVGWVEVLPFGDLVVRGAALWPERDAVVFPEERLTYAQLLDGAERAARSLLGLGVRPGEHVGILMANCADYAHLAFGVTMLGGVVVLINARYQGRDLAHVIADADLTWLVTSDIVAEHVDHLERLTDAFPALREIADRAGFDVPRAPRLRGIIALSDSAPTRYVSRAQFEEAGASVSADEVHELRLRVAIRSVGMMMYTSGTTNNPKGCLLSHEMIVRTGTAVGRRLDVQSEDRFWDPLPMFHMSAVLPLVACLSVGATFVSMTHFEPGTALRLLEDEGATHCYPTFPTITQALLEHPTYADIDLSRIRVVNNVAPPSTLRALQKSWPNAIQVTAYGSTETGGCVSFNELTDTLDQRVETSGRPFPGIELRIVAEDGSPVTTGERGEICVRGFSLFEGYHNDPDGTAAHFDAEGWFHTGDIGALDLDGRISYLGRLKDMLKVGGENVAAAEIEALLQEHPAVSIAQVVSLPDDRLVEVPAAFVMLRPGATLEEQVFIDWTTGRIASFKRPRLIRFVNEWPMSATKIQKYKLREQLLRELGKEA